MAEVDESVAAAVDILTDTKRLLVFSGAGLSAESGIPTFRDPEVGVWKNKIGLMWFGTPYGWRWTPTWAWYYFCGFLKPIEEAQPNPAHYAIAQLQGLYESSAVFTQNVDRLHQKAGGTNIYEVHGSVSKYVCIKHRHPMEVSEESFERRKPLVRCPECNSYPRPDCVLYTESLSDTFDYALSEIQNSGEETTLLIVGTSATVYPAAEIPHICNRKGFKIIESNIERTDFSDMADVFLEGQSGELLPPIVDEVTTILSRGE